MSETACWRRHSAKVISHFRATSPFSRAILFLPTAMLTEYEQQRERNVRSCRF